MGNRYKCKLSSNQICIYDVFEDKHYTDVDFSELQYLSQFSNKRFYHDLSILQKLASGEIQFDIVYNSSIYQDDGVITEILIVEENTYSIHTSSILEKTTIRGSLPKTIVINGVGQHTCKLGLEYQSFTRDIVDTVNISIVSVLHELSIYSYNEVRVVVSAKDLSKVDRQVMLGRDIKLVISELNNNQPIPKVLARMHNACLYIDCAKFDMGNFISIYDGLRIENTVHLNTELYNISEWFDYVVTEYKKGTWRKQFNIVDNGKIAKWLVEQERVNELSCQWKESNNILMLIGGTEYYISEFKKNSTDRIIIVRYKNNLFAVEFSIGCYFINILE